MLVVYPCYARVQAIGLHQFILDATIHYGYGTLAKCQPRPQVLCLYTGDKVKHIADQIRN